MNVSSFTVNYEEYEGFDDRGGVIISKPTTKPVVHGRSVPVSNFNLRGSAYRSDAVTPLEVLNKVLIEFRGYGLKKDTPEERQTRIKHHNSIWGLW